MSSQSWLDYRIQRINYFLRVILCRLFITSINNSSQAPTQIILIRFLKSMESNSGLAELLYRFHSVCQHPVNFIFSSLPDRSHLRNTEEADHYNPPNQLVKQFVHFNFKGTSCRSTLPRKNCALYSLNYPGQAVISTSIRNK